MGTLAKELGVSDRTISQALNPRESNVKLNPKTVEKIQKLAAEKNYRPDSRARSMRYGRFFNIGYFEATKSAISWPLLGAESGVFDEAVAQNYRIILVRLPSEMSTQPDKIPLIFREANLDALILSHAGNLTKELEDVIGRSNFPVVYLNEKKSHNAVYVDDFNGAAEITRYLISLGNNKIGFFGSSSEAHYSYLDRRMGYENAMKMAGLNPEVFTSHQKTQEFLQWLDAHKDMEAVVCWSDYGALLVFKALYNSPIRVPTHLALTGFGDDFYCSPVELTTMRIPFYDMGKDAVKMAVELIDGNQKPIQSRIFSPELIVRSSTRNQLA